MTQINNEILTLYVNDYNDFLSLIPDLSSLIHSQFREGEIDFSANELWFRGVTNSKYGLEPSIYHAPAIEIKPEDHFLSTTLLKMKENFLIEALPLVESERLHSLFFNEDKIYGWLKIMQHYRTPTNLLDFTVKVNVALYFALAEYFQNINYCSDDIPCVWVLFPSILNYMKKDKLRRLIDFGSYSKDIPLLDDFKMPSVKEIISSHLAIRAIYDANNIKCQQGVFVNFPVEIQKADKDDYRLDYAKEAHKYLIKILVMEPHKMTSDLWSLGERPWDYLPHLDIIGKVLASDRFNQK